MIDALKRALSLAGDAYVRARLRRDFATQRYLGLNERAVELRFVFDKVTQLAPQTVLDVGPGTTALPALLRTCGCVVTAIDNGRDYWSHEVLNRHFHVLDDDIRSPHLSRSFDLITCVSVLEHIVDHGTAVSGMYSLLKRGGHLVLTCPYSERVYCPNVYALPESGVKQRPSFVTQSYSRRELDRWLTDSHWDLVEQEFWQFFSGPLWTLGERIMPPVQVNRDDLHQLTCLLLRRSQ